MSLLPIARSIPARAGLAAAVLCLALAPAPAAFASEAEVLEQQRMETADERAELMDRIALSDERIAALSAEIEALKKDHETLTAALLRTADAERRLSGEIERHGSTSSPPSATICATR